MLLTLGPSAPDGWPDAPQAFAALDAAGCSAIWLADHLFWGSPMPEALVMAAVAVTSTSRCVVGTGVLQLPLRRAAAVARAATTLQVVSRGRFVLGVGSGEHEAEYRLVGAEFARRGRALDAGIDEVRACWRAPDDWYGQRPSPPPIPIWVGGRSEAAIARAASRADGWMPIFITPEGYEEASRRLDERLGQAGRPAGAVHRAVVAIVSTTDRGWTRADALGWAGRLWRMDPGRIEHFVITGSAEQCVEELLRFHAAGADHITVLPASDDPVRMLEDLSRVARAPAAP